MNRLSLLTDLVKTTTQAVILKLEQTTAQARYESVKAAHLSASSDAEQDLIDALEPMFKRQAMSMAGRVDQHGAKVSSDQLLDVDLATTELIDLVLPILAIRMTEAAHNELTSMGVDLTKTKLYSGLSTKSSSATDWLMEQEENLEDLLEDMPQFVPGSMPFQVVTELPEAMKQRIVGSLRESFDQDYWKDISRTTRGDAERVLERGLQEGLSTQQMAKQIRESLGGDQYARTRAFSIARTEAGGSLNMARRDVMDQLQEDVGDQIPMVILWHSVLGDTTREDHAALHNTPANEEGLWDLGGYLVPVPSHFSLPPEQRCNCACTIVMDFEMEKVEAAGIIQDYYTE